MPVGVWFIVGMLVGSALIRLLMNKAAKEAAAARERRLYKEQLDAEFEDEMR